MHASPITGTQLPDGTDIPDVPTHLEGIVRSLESYGVARFATTGARNLAWPNPPNGALSYTDADHALSQAQGGAWGPLIPGYVNVNGIMRDPYCAWGIMAGAQAIVPNPVSTDIMLITDQGVYHTVTGYGLGSITFAAQANRQYRVDTVVRLDGGAFASGLDGTAQVRILRTLPTSLVLVEALVLVPALSAAGGGTSNVPTIFGFDAPGAGTCAYELQVLKRIPNDTTTALRVRYPALIAVFDVGPLGPDINPASRGGTLVAMTSGYPLDDDEPASSSQESQ